MEREKLTGRESFSYNPADLCIFEPPGGSGVGAVDAEHILRMCSSRRPRIGRQIIACE
jgi:hypothetical protein